MIAFEGLFWMLRKMSMNRVMWLSLAVNCDFANFVRYSDRILEFGQVLFLKIQQFRFQNILK